jgi:uncharacterized membrane protein HdeD (DUF308 family)
MNTIKSPTRSTIVWASVLAGIVTILGGLATVIQPFANVEILRRIYEFMTPEIQEAIIKIVFGVDTVATAWILYARTTKVNEPLNKKQQRLMM